MVNLRLKTKMKYNIIESLKIRPVTSNRISLLNIPIIITKDDELLSSNKDQIDVLYKFILGSKFIIEHREERKIIERAVKINKQITLLWRDDPLNTFIPTILNTRVVNRPVKTKTVVRHVGDNSKRFYDKNKEFIEKYDPNSVQTWSRHFPNMAHTRPTHGPNNAPNIAQT